MKNYESEGSINRVLAQLQMAGTALEDQNENEDSFEILLREAIESENGAIKIYLKLKEKSEKLDSDVLIKAFEEITKDEQEHVGNLTYLLGIFCPKAIEVEKEGEQKEIEIQLKPEE